MRQMTEDTKRALAAIEPVAAELGIEVRADGRFLYCDGQAIGISCNSTFATVKEFIAYCAWWLSTTEGRFARMLNRDSRVVENSIKRYWISDEMVRMLEAEKEIEK